MPKLDTSAKLALVSAAVFIVISYSATYDATRGVLGSTLNQPDAGSYGLGNTYRQRGFLVHAVVFAVLMYVVAKYGLKV